MKDKAIHDAMVSIENRVRHVYNQGFEEGRKTCSYDGSDIAAAYQRGLDDAWECARSLCDTDVGETREIFGMSWWRVFEKMSATEAIQKLKEYKQALIDTGTIDEPKQTEIRVGDEVISDYGTKGVVVGIVIEKGEIMLSLLMKNHKVPQIVKATRYETKTGRHFPQIAEVLEQMQEGSKE